MKKNRKWNLDYSLKKPLNTNTGITNKKQEKEYP